jgi:hypothetical protein
VEKVRPRLILGEVTMTEWLTVLLAGSFHLASIYSAYYWWRSSKSKFKPSFEPTLDGRAIVGAIDIEGYLNSMAELNARAALGAATAVILLTTSALMASWPAWRGP